MRERREKKSFKAVKVTVLTRIRSTITHLMIQIKILNKINKQINNLK